MFRLPRLLAAPVALAMVAALITIAAPAAADPVIADVPCGSLESIRDANEEAQAIAGGDPVTLRLDGTCTYRGTVASIYANPSPVTIEGNGATLEGNDLAPVVQATHVVTVRDLTVTGGNGVVSNRRGGGIEGIGRASNLTLERVTVTGNRSLYGGGVGTNQGRITILDSTVADNQATFGGGVAFYRFGNSTDPDGQLTIRNSSISGNTADFGGAVFVESLLGIGTDVELDALTLVDNTALVGSVLILEGESRATLTGSVVAGNQNQEGANGRCVTPSLALTDGGGNVYQDVGCRGLLDPDTDPPNPESVEDPAARSYLSELADHGGPTPTHLPVDVPDNPLLDLTAPGVRGCGSVLATDQRGESRPQGAGCDAGAVELVAPTTGSIAGTVTDAGGAPLGGVDVYTATSGDVSVWWSATTGDDGTYEISAIPAGDQYVVFFSGPSAATCYADNGTCDPGLHTLVAVEPGQQTLGIDAELVESTGGSIAGTVTDGTGAGLDGVQVWAVRQGFSAIRVAFTDLEGDYEILGLEPGSWFLWFNTGTVSQCYVVLDCPAGIAIANTIAADEVLAGRDTQFTSIP